MYCLEVLKEINKDPSQFKNDGLLMEFTKE
jgi:hypothetical protein